MRGPAAAAAAVGRGAAAAAAVAVAAVSAAAAAARLARLLRPLLSKSTKKATNTAIATATSGPTQTHSGSPDAGFAKGARGGMGRGAQRRKNWIGMKPLVFVF
jgi:hypothetical protein